MRFDIHLNGSDTNAVGCLMFEVACLVLMMVPVEKGRCCVAESHSWWKRDNVLERKRHIHSLIPP